MERTQFPDKSGQIQVLSALVGRMALASRLGYQYGGDRNVYQALGYPEMDIDYASYAAKYARQDIAKAIINRPVSATWKGPIRLREIGKEETEIEKAWAEMDKRLKLRNTLVRVDKLTSIGRYGVLLMGFDDVSSRAGFLQPVSTKGNRELLYVRPVGEGHAQIETLVKDTRDPRYGLPETYEIEYTEVDSSTTVSLKAHHSRVIHVTTELLESQIYGVPVLESVWNRLLDLEKLVGGSAEMFWRGARPGYQGKIKEDYTLPPEVEATLKDQFDEFEHNLRRYLAVEGVDIETLRPLLPAMIDQTTPSDDPTRKASARKTTRLPR